MCSAVLRVGFHCCLAERKLRQTKVFKNNNKKCFKMPEGCRHQREMVLSGSEQRMSIPLHLPAPLNIAWGKTHTGRMWHSESKSWVFSNPK